MQVALRKIADMMGADIVSVSRVDHPESSRRNEHGSHNRVVAFDRKANFVNELTGFRVSYAEAVCGRYVAAAKPGTIWLARTSDFDGEPRLHAPLRHRRLVQTVAVALERHATSSDFLEMHFPEDLPADVADELKMLGPVMADIWKSRAMGILSNELVGAAQTRAPQAAACAENVLAIDNPCKLSRAEYRVCLLLSRGLDKNGLLEELSISLSTLRSHLRNIYAKTGTHSQVELIQLLLVKPQMPVAHGAHRVA